MISRRPRRPPSSANSANGALNRIGGELRAARLARREDLYDIADVLRIRPVYLAGLESGDISVMPGRPYALGFLKSYADYLGLDGRALAQEAKGPDGVPYATPALIYRAPVDERRRPTKALAAVSIVAAVLIYGVWHGYSSGRLELGERISGLPLQLGEAAVDLVAGDISPPGTIVMAAAPSATAAGPSTGPIVAAAPDTGLDELRLVAPEVSAEPGAAMAAARAPASDGSSAQAAERLPAAEAATAGAMLAALSDSAADGAGRVFGAPGNGGRILLIARESSWVQVRSRSRDYVRTRTLEAGERLLVPNRNDLSLWTGNAGGLEIQIDGRSVGVLGRRGDVLREVALDPDGLLRRAAIR
jgi:cytoskeleton protein RodZ